MKRRIATGLAVPSPAGLSPVEVLEQISAEAHKLHVRHSHVFADQIRPALAYEHIHLVHWDELDDAAKTADTAEGRRHRIWRRIKGRLDHTNQSVSRQRRVDHGKVGEQWSEQRGQFARWGSDVGQRAQCLNPRPRRWCAVGFGALAIFGRRVLLLHHPLQRLDPAAVEQRVLALDRLHGRHRSARPADSGAGPRRRGSRKGRRWRWLRRRWR